MTYFKSVNNKSFIIVHLTTRREKIEQSKAIWKYAHLNEIEIKLRQWDLNDFIN